MSLEYKIIGQDLVLDTEATIYTVPLAKQATITAIFIANYGDTECSYNLAILPAGESISLKNYLRYGMLLASKDFENISTKITMSAGDSIVISSSLADNLAITIFGVEQ